MLRAVAINTRRLFVNMVKSGFATALSVAAIFEVPMNIRMGCLKASNI